MHSLLLLSLTCSALAYSVLFLLAKNVRRWLLTLPSAALERGSGPVYALGLSTATLSAVLEKQCPCVSYRMSRYQSFAVVSSDLVSHDAPQLASCTYLLPLVRDLFAVRPHRHSAVHREGGSGC